MNLVIPMERGTVKQKTRTSVFERTNIIRKEPMTVMNVVSTWIKSLDKDVLIVSIS